MSSIVDTGMRACNEPSSLVDTRIARLVLIMQQSAARITLNYARSNRGPTGPGVLLGQCAAVLGPRHGWALVWAWWQRLGTWSRSNLALFYSALEASTPPTSMPLHRAVKEVELLSTMLLQPPPLPYLSALLGILAAKPEGSNRCAAATLAQGVRLELLGALATQSSWTDPANPATTQVMLHWSTLVTNLVTRCLEDERLGPQPLVRLMVALKQLNDRHGYTLQPW